MLLLITNVCIFNLSISIFFYNGHLDYFQLLAVSKKISVHIVDMFCAHVHAFLLHIQYIKSKNARS